MKQTKNILNKQRGITLIALVITIVVMLILAGVTINLTLGQNGIFTTAQKATQNYTQAQNQEMADLNNFETLLNNTVSNAQETLNGSWSSKNKVNKPNLANTGLIPVTINSNGTYGAPDIEADDWYSYDGTTNKWANAQTKDGSMWVWIPRFAYKINYTDATDKSQGGTIDVVFLQGTTDNYYDEAGELKTAQRATVDNKETLDTTTQYTVHPAFTNETGLDFENGGWDSEIPGFWMSKFEAGYVGKAGDGSTATDSNVKYTTIMSSNGTVHEDYGYNYYGSRAIGTAIKYPTFQANRLSMNYIGISDAYDLCKDIKNGRIYGLSNIDSHLTKNSEWGAVSYLAYSKYGRNGTEGILNNVNTITSIVYAVTGYAATGTNEATLTTTWDKIEAGTQAGSWLTSQGQTASTTGNAYGIYDMSGGTWEWTSAYIATLGNYETYGGNLKGVSNKYKTEYKHIDDGKSYTANYNANRFKIGDAIVETSSNASEVDKSWNKDYSAFPTAELCFFIRGGGWYDKTKAGIFAFNRNRGYGYNSFGFRAVLIAD